MSKNKRFTEKTVGNDYRLLDYGDSTLISMYKNYDVFFAHLVAINRLGELEDMITLRHVDDWAEDYGSCLWWDTATIDQEPMYVGSPLCSDWRDDMKYFMELPNPIIPENLKEKEN